MKVDRLRRALQDRLPVRDQDFDAIYPFAYREVSAEYWTPVDTARRAAELLVGEGARRILDVGAGVGKFCLVGAASTTQACFVGIEQRVRLVQAARDAQHRLRAERVEILHGRLDEIDTAAFDAFYFFNPFGENIFRYTSPLGTDVPLSRERYEADVRQAAAVLTAAGSGTRVVTYNGYGGRMPGMYELVHAERHHSSPLQLWIHT
jgi:SAM-dependent methyltransferase